MSAAPQHSAKELVVSDEWVVTDTQPKRFTVGVDLGKMSDHTALVVIEESHRREERRMRLKFGPDRPERVASRVRREYAVRNVHRYPVGCDYLAITRSVAGVLGQLSLREERPELVVDASGVGRPVIDLLRHNGLAPVAVTITSGEHFVAHGTKDFGVAKSLLVSTLDAVLADDRLSITGESSASAILRQELAGFRAKRRASGTIAFEGDARQGVHDDVVMALAVALWRSESRLPPPRMVEASIFRR
ncbi:hypothetical protein J2D73_16685 [Acetobacter sacchari]|uniref:Terminase large subunit gp17-like C-terminal domain-containing protein n=1 Tax=Acetobacter sacchari TaxID=2661687 RepID=A0ABS3LZS2_9PROT|nr:hypothetical protein [Acetobacter sacchari]MBO1361423.1 hypothetical protein [Acetobacter sacchari]